MDSGAQQSGFAFLKDDDKQFFGGAVLGMNISQVDGDAFAGYHKVGLNAGGLVYWAFTDYFAGSMEIIYSQKGSKGVRTNHNTTIGSYYSKYTMRLNYVEVPVNFHFPFMERYLFGFGGSFNALLSSDESMDEAGHLIPFDDTKETFNSYTFDLMASVGIIFREKYILEGRFQYGITALRNWQNVIPFTAGMGESDQFNNMVTFRLIYLF